jgi:hypothetical protein
MRLLIRAIAALLIVTLAINLGDWPFIDELLADLQEQGSFLSGPNEGQLTSVNEPKPDEQHGVPLRVGYQSLNSFTVLSPPPDNVLSIPSATRGSPPSRVAAATVEFIQTGPFRPPAV